MFTLLNIMCLPIFALLGIVWKRSSWLNALMKVFNFAVMFCSLFFLVTSQPFNLPYVVVLWFASMFYAVIWSTDDAINIIIKIYLGCVVATSGLALILHFN